MGVNLWRIREASLHFPRKSVNTDTHEQNTIWSKKNSYTELRMSRLYLIITLSFVFLRFFDLKIIEEEF